jgi:hypothetical protein
MECETMEEHYTENDERMDSVEEADSDEENAMDEDSMTVCFGDLDISLIPQDHLDKLSEHESLDITHDVDAIDAVLLEHAAELDQETFDIALMNMMTV